MLVNGTLFGFFQSFRGLRQKKPSFSLISHFGDGGSYLTSKESKRGGVSSWVLRWNLEVIWLRHPDFLWGMQISNEDAPIHVFRSLFRGCLNWGWSRTWWNKGFREDLKCGSGNIYQKGSNRLWLKVPCLVYPFISYPYMSCQDQLSLHSRLSLASGIGDLCQKGNLFRNRLL